MLRFLMIVLGAGVAAGVAGMGIGAALGWVWERAHRFRRRSRRPVSQIAVGAPTPSVGTSTGTPGEGSAPGSRTLVIIFGPPAVGKMTVGDSLARKTGLSLFHNHLTIELLLRFFEYGSPPFRRLNSEFRTRIFEEVAASSLPGLIFTFVWAFEDESDTRYVDQISAVFRVRGADVFLVELEAAQSERLLRNRTSFRLEEKRSKRDLAASRERLLKLDAEHRLNSIGELGGRSDYLRIDNTALSADEVAERIIEQFGIERITTEKT
jgi:hypothetical protein